MNYLVRTKSGIRHAEVTVRCAKPAKTRGSGDGAEESMAYKGRELRGVWSGDWADECGWWDVGGWC